MKLSANISMDLAMWEYDLLQDAILIAQAQALMNKNYRVHQRLGSILRQLEGQESKYI